MSSVRSAENLMRSTINQVGRATAHYLFPNDIEYYFCALELVDSEDRTIDFFSFPVTPKSIFFQDDDITVVKRTIGGITSIKTSTFDIKNITINGNFGRKFKIIIGGRPITFDAFNFNFQEGFNIKNFSIDPTEISFAVKTGYGCIKVLERIVKNADGLDEQNNPYRLYFYNTSLNQSWLIEPESLNFNQSVQENMIWNYNFRFKAVADLRKISLFNNGSLLNLLAISTLNNVANNVANRITRSLRNGVR